MDPLTLYVYAGANGQFTLYEDDGQTYGYEKGEYARIPMTWNDVRHTLTIGKRQGGFPTELARRTFNIVFVSREKGIGFTFDPKPDQSVTYTGDAVEIHP
jgi:alpha-D-xyloside xylohydrolase